MGAAVKRRAKEHADLKETDRFKRLLEVISGAQRPLIIIYSNPDPDALASALALREIMNFAKVTASIEYTGEVGRLENVTMLDLLNIPASPLKEKSLEQADLIAVVDSQPDFFQNIELPRCDIVIDHHPRKSRRTLPFCDIRSRCLATSSIMTAYLRAGGINVSRRLATALYYGIRTDSRNLQRKPTTVDLDAMRFLEQKIDRSIIRRIEFSSYSLRNLDYFAVALVKLRYRRNVLYSNIGLVPSIDICAQIADFLIRVREAGWAVVSGVVEGKLAVIFRSDGYKRNAGKMAEAAFGQYGSAGGHRTMARAEILADQLPEDTLLTQNERLEKFILQQLSRAEKSFRPLLRKIK